MTYRHIRPGAIKLAIRTARLDDVPAMHRIRLAVRENALSESTDIGEPSYRPFIEAGSAWIAEGADGMLGFAAVDGAAATVWALFVDPTAQGAGTGRALERHLLAWAAGRHIGRLRLTTAPGSRAERFYLASGWSVAR